MLYEEIRKKTRPFLHINLLIKDSLQQRIHFNGDVFVNKCCRCKEGVTVFADFMYYHIVIIENTQAQYFDNLLSKLCASVLNSTVKHQVSQYNALFLLHSLSLYLFFVCFFCQNIEMEIDSNLPI